jgi:hypothetical protein
MHFINQSKPTKSRYQILFVDFIWVFVASITFGETSPTASETCPYRVILRKKSAFACVIYKGNAEQNYL